MMREGPLFNHQHRHPSCVLSKARLGNAMRTNEETLCKRGFLDKILLSKPIFKMMLDSLIHSEVSTKLTAHE